MHSVSGANVKLLMFALDVANNTDRRSTLSSLSSYLESNGKGVNNMSFNEVVNLLMLLVTFAALIIGCMQNSNKK